MVLSFRTGINAWTKPEYIIITNRNAKKVCRWGSELGIECAEPELQILLIGEQDPRVAKLLRKHAKAYGLRLSFTGFPPGPNPEKKRDRGAPSLISNVKREYRAAMKVNKSQLEFAAYANPVDEPIVLGGPTTGRHKDKRFILEHILADEENPEHGERIIEDLNELVTFGNDLGVVYSPELLNNYESGGPCSVRQALELKKLVPGLVFQWDGAHARINDLDFYKGLRDLIKADALGNVHLSELGEGRTFYDGRGEVARATPRIFSILKKAGYEGSAVIETFPPELAMAVDRVSIHGDLDEGIASSIAFVNEVYDQAA